MSVAVAVIAVVVVVVVARASSKRRAIPEALRQVLAAPPWKKLDAETWTLKRGGRPSIFFMPSSSGQHRLWVHYYDDEDGPIPGLTVEVCVAPASPSRATPLSGLPDGMRGSISFEVNEGPHWLDSPVLEEHIAKAREWLADAGALASLPGSKLSIDPSHSGGFRIHVYWNGGDNELAVAVRVAESVDARIVPEPRRRD
ncbi:MAG TPA: hypothetical protein VGO62_00710 [Myxococcota bacterium]